MWPDNFIKTLKECILKRIDETDFIPRYNNAFMGRRNRSPRTCLMLGDNQGGCQEGLIFQTLKVLYADDEYNLKNPGPTYKDIGVENYRYDCLVYCDFGDNKDNWWKGKRFIDTAIEVENDLKEFQGTFADLVQIQAHKKIGIFYTNDISPNFLAGKKEEAKEVYSFFLGLKFCESRNTEYLIIFLPEKINKNDPVASINQTSVIVFKASDCDLSKTSIC